ncbi:TonB-dependent siderophore receptor [Achromobacter sp.]|uniref:TonB-dependent siderophore receptor n=1 Tax=Achromobacter sp. TaxID=134375 RepID=UPI0028A88A5E|nr:TonB-dependent siderophore receptor [Achromobacter sp.]
MTPAALPSVAFAPRRIPTYRLTLAAALLAQAILPVPVRAADAVPQLSPVRVTGSAEALSDPGQTEGSQSYTANTVTVGKTAANVRDVPNSVSVVTRQRMDDQNMVSVEDALRQTTGVSAMSYGDGTAYFTARGYETDVQFDGVPANGALQYLPQFDLALYDRIEVLRGPAGLLQGFGSPAGTVNLVRKRPLDTFSLTGAVMAGSWNNYRTEMDVTGPITADGRVRGRAGFAGQDRDFFYDQAHNRQGLAYGSLEFDLTANTTLTLSAAYQRQRQAPFDYGLPIYSNGQIIDSPRKGFYGTDWSRGDTTLSEIYSELSHRFANGWTGQVSMNYRATDMDSRYGYVNGPVNPANDRAGYRLQAQKDQIRWIGFDTHASGPFSLLGRTHQAMIGANYAERRQDGRSGGTNISSVSIQDIDVPDQDLPYTSGNRSKSNQMGVYGQVSFRVADPLTLIVGGRQSWYQNSTQPLLPVAGNTRRDPEVRKFVPYYGAVAQLNSWLSAYASYSDIYAFSEAWQMTTDGKPLKPRTGKQYEIGLKGQFLDGAANASLALFRIRDKNRAVPDDANPGRYLAQGEAQSQGIEAEITGRLMPNWDVYAGYTYLQTRYLSDPTQEGQIVNPETPKHLFKIWTTYRFTPDVLPDWRVGGGVRTQSRTSRNNVSWQGGYAVVDAQIGYKVNRNLDASLTLNNVFDRHYYARVPSNFYGIYGEPRNVMLTLRATY